jgi:hypothetical protein
MNKTLITCIAATSLLTACSNDDVLDIKSSSRYDIGFSSYVDNPTRSGVISLANLKDFGVYGYFNGGNNNAYEPIFYNEQIRNKNWDFSTNAFVKDKTSLGSDWSYTNIQYWVESKVYHFHAFAPYGSSNISWSTTDEDKANGYATGNITFTNGTESSVTVTPASGASYTTDYISADEDLIYAYKRRTTESAIPESLDKVALTFNHLLSRVRFKFINGFSHSNVEIEVKDIEITNAYNKAQINVGADKANGITDGVSNWALVTGSEKASEDSKEVHISFGDAYAASDTTQTQIHINEPLIAKYRNNNYGNTASKFLIPYAAPDETDGHVYKASYTINVYTYVNDYLNVDEADQHDTHTFTITDAELPQTMLLPGNSYIYTATIDADNIDPSNSSVVLKPIEFTVTTVKGYGTASNETLVNPDDEDEDDDTD